MKELQFAVRQTEGAVPLSAEARFWHDVSQQVAAWIRGHPYRPAVVDRHRATKRDRDADHGGVWRPVGESAEAQRTGFTEAMSRL